jgi:hypothetical protein
MINSVNVEAKEEEKEKPEENIPGKIDDYSQENIENVYNKVATKYGESQQELMRVLEQISQSPEPKRKALMFALMQNPEYRRIIDDVKGKKKNDQK